MKPIDLAAEDRERLASLARRFEQQMLSLTGDPDPPCAPFSNRALVETAAFWRRVAEAIST